MQRGPGLQNIKTIYTGNSAKYIKGRIKMSRRDKRIVKQTGLYQIVEVEFIDKRTGEVVDSSFEVRNREKFLVEFDNVREALMQLEFLLKLEKERRR